MGCDCKGPTGGDKVKKAICWMSEELLHNPQKKRGAVIREAEIRFDLSPAECEFLSKNFGDSAPC
ncbi:MAG: hypothetical protein D9V46_12255 [Deltaproteobacteria bacterium]|uniref:hypothetical protein n=1 Tax=Hydrosulfovibrio ferrireducens TaxID=2934181 RepID=UPI001204DE3A|nr:MAG: hypothetical protein D9V46_12255 [Deltaproteobacteria bacterium]